MKAVILVPYRAGGRRTRNWRAARSFWETLGLKIVTADGMAGPFQRAHARNRAAGIAGDWDVALFTDADIVLANRQQAEAAIMRAYITGAYTVAYSTLRYLTEEGTKYVAKGGPSIQADYNESAALTWECCFAVRRDAWDKVGGFDERFRGYGGQVAAFFYSVATFAGRERINGLAFHLAHKLVDRSGDPHFVDNVALCNRYLEAVDNPRKMERMLAER